MTKPYKLILSFLLLTTVLAVVITPQVQAKANTILDGITKTVGGTDLQTNKTNLPTFIGSLVQIFLGFLGIIAVILIIYAGYMWLTAGGDSAKVQKAKDYIKNTIIGIVIILISYIITSFVIDQISKTLK